MGHKHKACFATLNASRLGDRDRAKGHGHGHVVHPTSNKLMQSTVDLLRT